MRRAPLLLLVLAAACGQKNRSDAPWNTYPGVAGHSKYLLLSGTPHDPTAPGSTVTCAACHTGSSFTQFDCTTCHGAQTPTAQADLTAFHTSAGVTGFEWSSPACYRCHPNGLGVPADHSTRFFPIGTTSHPAVCSSCHTVPASPTDPQATTLANLACATCHRGQAAPTDLATLHAQVSAAAFDASTATSADCLNCHADDLVQSVTGHQAKFPVVKGSGSHDTVCLQCHTQSRTDKPYPAADFTAYDCLACHTNSAADTSLLNNTDAQHVGLTGYVYASANCYGCHPDGTGAPANHSTALFPIGTGSAHAAVSCTQCHTDLTNPTNPANFACATCHTSATGPTPDLIANHTSNTSKPTVTVPASELSTTDARTCLRCHADSQVDLTSSHPSGKTGDPPHQGAVCLQCHDVYRTDKTFGIDFASDPAAPSKCGPNPAACTVKQGCYECHPASPPQGF